MMQCDFTHHDPPPLSQLLLYGPPSNVGRDVQMEVMPTNVINFSYHGIYSSRLF